MSRPSLVIAVGSGLMVLGLLAATLPLSGFGAWIVRFAALLLAVPVVWLVARRRSVLARLAEMERTGEHPDNVVHTTTADGQSIEVIVAGAEQTVVPRVGVGSLAALSLASLTSGGLAFGLRGPSRAPLADHPATGAVTAASSPPLSPSKDQADPLGPLLSPSGQTLDLPVGPTIRKDRRS